MSASKDLIELFRQQVELQPTAIAIQDDHHTLTYSELERWSNNLAHEIRSRLKNNHEQGHNIVAVFIPRSALLVVSIFAIVKAGFSYLPLDISSTSTKLDSQISQAGVCLLLTVSWHKLPTLEQDISFDIVPFVDRTCVSSHTELPPFDPDLRNDILAVLFTSGSTGPPKGVLVKHMGILNLVYNPVMDIQPGDHVGMAINPAFDASAIDIWGTLCHGGTLFAYNAPLGDAETVVSFIREKKINKLGLPTPIFHHITSDVSNVASLTTTLRMLSVGGEKLKTASVQSFFRHASTASSLSLINAYGPSEASVCTTAFAISSLDMANEYDDSTSQSIPIGRCIPNASVYILDDNLHPVDTGLPGEICIGGVGLAAGYIGQEHLTAKKYVMVNNLEGHGSSTRVYRTGDIGKFVKSGDELLLHFMGRNDFQVQIRGQRFELGEIEAILCAGPGDIGQAAVVVAGDDKLIAYVVQNVDIDYQKSPDFKASPTHNRLGNSHTKPATTSFRTHDLIARLRKHCRERLPSHMVPHRIIIKNSLPLTHNGKVDRKMLAEPGMWVENQPPGSMLELDYPKSETQA
ncbi:hypothetical protein SERLA73DRAFT_159376 [Serpula lacrymans var. lacrymans S7.3]|uniref:AMP-dependent synthetase/ligase domain-containing protein n=2 Tax=Serpula lacrymans var. lacrymans TaxID=341189 RepID=F8PRQ6_SERL3|nr:uncharacterized protein SERLADRAFT_414331 [Serpula lacrymans var. lacrymans S7.9]EGO00626.1 hypothetical protein SERLA73DRAFT_159376 [Serpula lacrymans var. lacrymans S7.3]EGO26180.1 hypothetical protein SERLADRAFT_414331 [Serpula lacrymans var. lacrymans S7.9]